MGVNDQVKVILKSIGTLDQQDLSFITSEHALTYLKQIEDKQK